MMSLVEKCYAVDIEANRQKEQIDIIIIVYIRLQQLSSKELPFSGLRGIFLNLFIF